MGAWGSGSDENDGTLDFVFEFQNQNHDIVKGNECVEKAIKELKKQQSGVHAEDYEHISFIGAVLYVMYKGTPYRKSTSNLHINFGRLFGGRFIILDRSREKKG